jgi:hypothetical protein
MRFLFHTVIDFTGVPVYYNVYETYKYYFLELLDNPHEVNKARNFTLKKNKETWASTLGLNSKQLETLIEEIKAKRRDD